MKKLFFVLIFVGNTVLGWLIHAGARAENPQQSAQTSSAQRELATRTDRAKEAREKEFKNLAKKFSRIDASEQCALSRNIAPQDRGAFLEAFLKEQDPSGYSSEANRMIEDIVKIWAAEDFEGAWNWSRQIIDDNCRRYISGKVLTELAEKDLTRALALHMEISIVDPEFYSDAPFLALQETTRKSARDFLDVLGKIPLHQGGTLNFEFAKDFNFTEAAEGISALLRKQKELPHQFPMNYMEVWGERDPDGALIWLANQEHYNKLDFADLLEGVEKQGIPGAASAWVAKKIEESEKFRKVIIEGVSNPSAARLNGILKALPDSNSSDRFLTQLLVNQSQYRPIDFTTTLSGMSSLQARLDALAQVKKVGRDLGSNISETQYEAWGVTREQFETIFPPSGK
jgi:hypothetical protein